MGNDGISECFANCACARAKRASPASLRGVSRLLLDMLDRRGLRGRTVLELECGLGGLTLTTASHGATRSMGIDLSPVAIREASRLAEEAGLAEEVSFAVGDGAEMDLLKSDVVILDKVICCYPRVEALITNSLRATGSTYAFVVPFSSGIRGSVARMAIRGGERSPVAQTPALPGLCSRCPGDRAGAGRGRLGAHSVGSAVHLVCRGSRAPGVTCFPLSSADNRPKAREATRMLRSQLLAR
jgi:SAM-dependent methyltransferase